MKVLFTPLMSFIDIPEIPKNIFIHNPGVFIETSYDRVEAEAVYNDFLVRLGEEIVSNAEDIITISPTDSRYVNDTISVDNLFMIKYNNINNHHAVVVVVFITDSSKYEDFIEKVLCRIAQDKGFMPIRLKHSTEDKIIFKKKISEMILNITKPVYVIPPSGSLDVNGLRMPTELITRQFRDEFEVRLRQTLKPLLISDDGHTKVILFKSLKDDGIVSILKVPLDYPISFSSDARTIDIGTTKRKFTICKDLLMCSTREIKITTNTNSIDIYNFNSESGIRIDENPESFFERCKELFDNEDEYDCWRLIKVLEE